MPLVPEKADGEALTGARDLLADFLTQLNRWTPGRGADPRLDMGGVPPATLAITNEMLGDGEVSIQVNGKRRLRIQESVFTGLWRVVELDRDGGLLADWIEVGPAARGRGRSGTRRRVHRWSRRWTSRRAR